jgi:hypothetical protein
VVNQLTLPAAQSDARGAKPQPRYNPRVSCGVGGLTNLLVKLGNLSLKQFHQLQFSLNQPAVVFGELAHQSQSGLKTHTF